MARQLAATPSSKKTPHLMCGSRLWTIVAFASCAYFARVAFLRAHSSLTAWSHASLDIATHLVWVAFMVGLIAETRCWTERVFYFLVALNFGMAFTMGVWGNAPDSLVGTTRQLSAALWALAALISLLMIFLPGDKSRAGGSA